VTRQACVDCHAEVVQQMRAAREGAETISCVHCHKEAGHALR
jgi:hypothetical protein